VVSIRLGACEMPRALLVALAFTAVACGPVSPPEGAPSAPAAPGPSAATFDFGAVKTAAEYLKEPSFAAVDLERGELLALACAACHTLGRGDRHNIGPNLHGVFGRRAASVANFEYSRALRESGLTWTPRALEAWLAEPTQFVPGTTMAFTGYRDAEDRRDLIAYLLVATQ
jgi:cytochrome c